MLDFQKLQVYQKAKLFHRKCKRTIGIHSLDRFVKDQLGRASFSIMLNIAEGSGKFSKPDRRNYFLTARGSLYECIAALDALKDEAIITEEEYADFEILADEIARLLYTMAKNLS
jgi:four helix bundle protein